MALIGLGFFTFSCKGGHIENYSGSAPSVILDNGDGNSPIYITRDSDSGQILLSFTGLGNYFYNYIFWISSSGSEPNSQTLTEFTGFTCSSGGNYIVRFKSVEFNQYMGYDTTDQRNDGSYTVGSMFDNVGNNTDFELKPATAKNGLPQLQIEYVIMLIARSCPGLNLSNLNFSGYDLNNTDFTGVLGIIGTDFSSASMKNVILRGQDLGSAKTFAHTDFTGADFTTVATAKNGRYQNAVFTDCTLKNVDFSSSQFQNAVFSNAKDLSGTNFSNSHMDNADFSNAENLSGAIFKGCSLTGTVFKNCNLTGADFADADLTGASLTDSNLTGADFSNAKLNGTNFSSSTMTNVKLTGAILSGTNFSFTDVTQTVFDPEPKFSIDSKNLTIFKNAKINLSVIKLNWSYLDLSDASIIGLNNSTDLSGLKAQFTRIRGDSLFPLNNAKLTDADFSGADLKVDFSYSHFADKADDPVATFEGAILNGSNLTDAKLAGTNFKLIQGGGTITTEAVNFENAYMPNAVLTGAILNSANFSNAQFYGNQAKVDNADLTNANFSNAILTGLDLTGARLRGATFDGAVLIASIFKGANLTPSTDGKQTSFVGANLIGTDFTKSNLQGVTFSNAVVSVAQGVPLAPFTIDIKIWRDAFTQLNLRSSANIYKVPQTATDYNVMQFPTYTLTFDNSQINTYNIEIQRGPEGSPPVIPIDNPTVSIGDILLDSSATNQLNAGELPTDLQKTLAINNVCQINTLTKGKAWTITQEPAVSDAVGYHSFGLRVLDEINYIIGTELMVSRLGSNYTLELVIVEISPTLLTSDTLAPDTICPNGSNYSTNLAENITFGQMMTPHQAPNPPVCVPSDDSWCPAPRQSQKLI